MIDYLIRQSEVVFTLPLQCSDYNAIAADTTACFLVTPFEIAIVGLKDLTFTFGPDTTVIGRRRRKKDLTFMFKSYGGFTLPI